MTTPNLRDLIDKVGRLLGAWGEALEETRELTLVLVGRDAGGKGIARHLAGRAGAGGRFRCHMAHRADLVAVRPGAGAEIPRRSAMSDACRERMRRISFQERRRLVQSDKRK